MVSDSLPGAELPMSMLLLPEVRAAMLLTPTAVSRAPVETPGFPALVPRKRSVGPWAQAVAARANREKTARARELRDELRMNEPPSRCHPPLKPEWPGA